MRQAGIDDPHDIERVRAQGVIDLPTIQKRANLHFSLTLDLFGSEISTNAANAFNAGLKGRYLEDQIDDDHLLASATYPVLRLKDGQIMREDVRGALGAQHAAARRLRRRRRLGGRALVEPHHRPRRVRFRLRLPHVAFNRRIGEFAAIEADPDGNILSARGMGSAAATNSCRPPKMTRLSPA